MVKIHKVFVPGAIIDYYLNISLLSMHLLFAHETEVTGVNWFQLRNVNVIYKRGYRRRHQM